LHKNRQRNAVIRWPSTPLRRRANATDATASHLTRRSWTWAGFWLALTAALLVSAAPAHAARIMQADDQLTCEVNGGDVNEFLQAHHATVLRIVVPFRGYSNALACARKAAAQSYRVYLSIQYDNRWRPAQVAAYFRRTLPQYAPYAWAVSVGNEQDLSQGAPAPHGRSIVCSGTGRSRTCRRSSAGEDYRAVWNAVEPVLARTTPRAIRVYGETSPFSFSLLKDSFLAGQPRGAQAIAFHCYDTRTGGLRAVPQVAAWAASKHLPLWCSEMSAALAPNIHSWLQRDSQSQWDSLVAWMEARSPNLKMVSYYRWPQIGAL
jgi:hypothetical protein